MFNPCTAHHRKGSSNKGEASFFLFSRKKVDFRAGGNAGAGMMAAPTPWAINIEPNTDVMPGWNVPCPQNAIGLVQIIKDRITVRGDNPSKEVYNGIPHCQVFKGTGRAAMTLDLTTLRPRALTGLVGMYRGQFCVFPAQSK